MPSPFYPRVASFLFSPSLSLALSTRERSLCQARIARGNNHLANGTSSLPIPIIDRKYIPASRTDNPCRSTHRRTPPFSLPGRGNQLCARNYAVKLESPRLAREDPASCDLVPPRGLLTRQRTTASMRRRARFLNDPRDD